MKDDCSDQADWTSAAAIAEARTAGDGAFADALQAEARTLATAGVNPRDVLLFHLGSMASRSTFDLVRF